MDNGFVSRFLTVLRYDYEEFLTRMDWTEQFSAGNKGGVTDSLCVASVRTVVALQMRDVDRKLYSVSRHKFAQYDCWQFSVLGQRIKQQCQVLSLSHVWYRNFFI